MEDYVKKSGALKVIDTIMDMTKTYMDALKEIRVVLASVESVALDVESEIDE